MRLPQPPALGLTSLSPAPTDGSLSHSARHREENLLTALSVDGHSSWGQLYTTLSSSAQCEINGAKMGVAKAAGLLSSADRSERRAAWDGIQAAWKVHEEAVRAPSPRLPQLARPHTPTQQVSQATARRPGASGPV